MVDRIRIGITGFDGLDNPHPGTPVARALRAGSSRPVEIEALGYDPLMTGAWMPGVADRLYVLPTPDQGDAAMLARILEINARYPMNALIPCLDLDVPVISRLSGRLANEGIGTLVPKPDMIYAVSKLRLPKFCHENGIATPRTIHVLDPGDLALHADQFGYPLFVKGVVAGAKFVGSRTETVCEAREINAEWGGGVLLQEPVDGEEFVIAAVIGQDGRCLGMVAMRKLGLSGKGKAVLGAVIDDPEVLKWGREVISRLDWHGPLEIEAVRASGSKQMRLIEINCRMPSWIALAPHAGCNLPWILLEEILGAGREPAPPPRPTASFIRGVEETAVPLDHLRALARGQECEGPPPAPMRGRSGDSDGVTVAVSGIGTLDVVNAGLGTARALREAPGVASVLGLGYGRFDSGLYRDDLFDTVCTLPLQDDPGVLLERLTEIHAATPFDVVIPCLDGELRRFIAIRDDLRHLGVHTLLPETEALAARGKLRLFTDPPAAADGSFLIPPSVRVASDEEVEAAVARLGLPVMIKGRISLALPAESVDEALAAWNRLRREGNGEALVQTLIAGERYATAAVCDSAHHTMDAFTIRKLRTCDRGSTWSAIVVREPDLEDAFAGFLRTIGWVGPVEGEFIRDELTDRFFLIEVNPRFTAWIAYSAWIGRNHPWLATALALGREPGAMNFREDLVFMRSCDDTMLDPAKVAAVSTRGALQHA